MNLSPSYERPLMGIGRVCQPHKHLPGVLIFLPVDAVLGLLLIFASPQAAEYGKPEDTERRVGGRSDASRDGNRKTHRVLQGKQEGRLGHVFFHSPCTPLV